ncbi:FecR family protein [Roseibium algae]|uniref:FecR family protein n=1 Tax=Roseibium algae TaxID=3123038 RepID=A0ABU8TQV0_9HYPH
MPKRRLTGVQRKRHQEAADWVLRNREPEQSSGDTQAFCEWLECDAENQRAYDVAEQLLGDVRAAIKSDPVLNSFEARPANTIKAATGTLLSLAAAGTLFFYFDGPMRLQADVLSGVLDLPVVELADGSTIHMNASSAIAYSYTDHSRTVSLLRGEAFFEVAADPARPFTVVIGGTRVTALGTAFDIRRGDVETEVTVTHNAVLVEFADPELTPVRLEEGHSIDHGADGSLSEITPANTNSVLAWQRGMLVLDNAPLSYVVEELERRFSGKIVISNAGLADRRVSGTIAIANTQAAIAFLEKALNLQSVQIGPLILLRD